MDVAVYLLDNGVAIDEAVTSTQSTPLLAAASCSEIEILRMLLSRGASLDLFDVYGLSAVTRCIAQIENEPYKATTVDMLKVINEFGPLDTDPKGSRGILHLAAVLSSAREIDFLVSLGCKVDDRFDGDHRAAIRYAALDGNSATYFALLAHGATTGPLERELLALVAVEANPAEWDFDEIHERGISDPIIKDLLNRRVDLMNSICVIDGEVEDIQGPAIPLQQAVAAYGPEIEAWFLGLLQECGLEDEEDRRRLQELWIAGYDEHGTVIGEVDNESDCDSGDGDSEYASSEWEQSSVQSEADDSEEEEEESF
jgi:hypothetical protein